MYHELYDSPVKAKKNLKSKIVENDTLYEKIKHLEKENHDLNMFPKELLPENKVCSKCEAYKIKNYELSKALQRFINNKNRMNDMLER